MRNANGRNRDLSKIIARNVGRLARQRGWSLRRLAIEAKASRMTVNRLARGEGRGGLHTLGQVAAALGVPPQELLEDR